MAVAETANLLVKMSLGGNYVSQLSKATRATKGFDKEASRAYKAGTQIGTGIKRGAVIAAAGVGVLVSQVALGLDSLIKLEKATAQTNAVIKSTGGIANVSADEVRKLAEKYEALNATIGDEVIQAGQNLLLTYTAVRKEAFEPALKAALDLSVALGTDLDSAIATVGKALSDPVKGIARLTRAGIILTKEEQDQIKAHVKNNKTLAAQEVILAALDRRYGGSFLAGGQTTAGKVAKFTDSIEDLQRSLATALLPAVGNIADALSEFLQDPEVIRGAEELGKQIGTLFSKDNIKAGIGAIREGALFLKDIAGVVGTVVGTAVGAFRSLPPELQKLAIGAFAVNKLTGGLVTNLAGGLISAVISSFRGLMNVNAGIVNVNGGVAGGVPGVAGAAKTGLSTLSKVFLVGEAIGLALLVNEVKTGIENGNTQQAAAIQNQTAQWLAQSPSRTDLERGLAGVEQGIRDLESNPLNVLVQGEALDKLRGMQASIKGALRDIGANGRDSTTQAETTKGNVFGTKGLGESITDAQRKAGDKVTTAVESMRGKIADELGTARETIGRATTAAGNTAGRASTMAGYSVAAAVRASRPIITTNVDVHVTAAQVTKQVYVQQNYGPGNGSAGGGSSAGGAFGGH